MRASFSGPCGDKLMPTLPLNSASETGFEKNNWPVLNFDGSDDGAKWRCIADDKLELISHLFDRDKFTLKVLDQLILPHSTQYVEVESVEDGYSVIKKMQVRGAPLIATVGMLALLVDLRHRIHNLHVLSPAEFLEFVKEKSDLLVSARPTAVNLANIVGHLKQFLAGLLDEYGKGVELNKNSTEQDVSAEREQRVLSVRQRIEAFVLDWQAGERAQNDLLIRNSISALHSNTDPQKKLVVLTICNTGTLATSSFGSALGVIVHLHKLGRLQAALALETRPYNQGSRLTAYELSAYKVPFLLLADSAAAYAMKTYNVDAVLVGADQVASNGDTANKIGTYMLAVSAAHHHVPFYVVTPTSSINPNIASGADILVEERPAHELIKYNVHESDWTLEEFIKQVSDTLGYEVSLLCMLDENNRPKKVKKNEEHFAILLLWAIKLGGKIAITTC